MGVLVHAFREFLDSYDILCEDNGGVAIMAETLRLRQLHTRCTLHLRRPRILLLKLTTAAGVAWIDHTSKLIGCIRTVI